MYHFHQKNVVTVESSTSIFGSGKFDKVTNKCRSKELMNQPLPITSLALHFQMEELD